MAGGKSFSVNSKSPTIGTQLSDNQSLSMEAAGAFLRESEITGYQPLPRGSNYVYLLSLKRNGEDAIAIYKPRRGETPLWDFPEGTLYQREYATYLVSQALKWSLVPPTIIRDGPYGIGMLQWFVPTQSPNYALLFEKHFQEFKRIAAFDWLVNNADRKVGHCLEDLKGRLWLIDHGLTFNVVPKLRTVIWNFAGQPLPDEVLADFELLAGQLSGQNGLTIELLQLLSPGEVRALKERLMMILNHPIYPDSFGSHRRVPWPPF